MPTHKQQPGVSHLNKYHVGMEGNSDGTEHTQNNAPSSVGLCDIPSKLGEVEME